MKRAGEVGFPVSKEMEMFLCERCGIRFSTGALSGIRTCPRCHARDGVTSMLTWEPMLPARNATGAPPMPRREPEREVVRPGR